MNIEEEIKGIKERNGRVEVDKAWEQSSVRRGAIAGITYIVAYIWLRMINEPDAFLKAFVPTAGYILSTLSLPIIKSIWVRNKR